MIILSIRARFKGQLSYTTALDVYAYLKKERDLLPWTSGISNVGYVMLMLGQTPALPALRVK